MFVNRFSASTRYVRSSHLSYSRSHAFSSLRFFKPTSSTKPFTGRMYPETVSVKKMAFALCIGGSLFANFTVHAAQLPASMIEGYFKNFQALKKEENWKEILKQGEEALSIANGANLKKEEAKIYAQLATTSFYLGDYNKALQYVTRCHSLASTLNDSSILVRSLYLESAIYRATAPNQEDRHTQQMFFLHAVTTCKKALKLFNDADLIKTKLEGKLFFNLGAAYTDNPEGDLNEAEKAYSEAIKCFKEVQATEDLIRTSLRLGKVCLLQKNFVRTQQILDETRPLIEATRVSMHADYLEGQYAFAVKDYVRARTVVQEGLKKAGELGAVVDQKRLIELQQKIDQAMDCLR